MYLTKRILLNYSVMSQDALSRKNRPTTSRPLQSTAGEGNSLEVTVVSHSLEAHLVVCVCTTAGSTSNQNDDISYIFVIFSAGEAQALRVERGRNITIKQPWKEIALPNHCCSAILCPQNCLSSQFR